MKNCLSKKEEMQILLHLFSNENEWSKYIRRTIEFK